MGWNSRRASGLTAALLLTACSDGNPPPTPVPPPECQPESPALPSGAASEAKIQARLSLNSTFGPGDIATPCCSTTRGCSADTQDKFAAWYDTPISVAGRIFDDQGLPITGASLSLGSASVTTAEDGSFTFTDLNRRNEWLRVEADGFYPTLLGVALTAEAVAAEIRLPPILLTPKRTGIARLLFTGDVMLARRFMDPTATTPPDQIPPPDPDAWVNSASPAAGARNVVSLIQPLFSTVDFPVVNLETAVTNNPATPDPAKAYIFFTLPGALAALDALDLSYVSIANNHLCDYLEAGIRSTLSTLDARGTHYSGGGLDETAAFAPYRITVNSLPVALLAMSSAGPSTTVSCAATSTGPGVADLTQTAKVHAAIAAEQQAGNTVVAQLHAGEEYVYAPSAYTHSLMSATATAGAALVVGNHPHVPEGLWRVGDTLIAPSLGNFVFDQDRQDTVLTFVLMADLAAHRTLAAELVPVFIESYTPRMVAGALSARMTRTLAEASETDALSLAAYNGRGQIGWGDRATHTVDRTAMFSVHIPAAGWTIVDLRGVSRPEESLVRVQAPGSALSARLGRDLLTFGGFEDVDVDADLLEGTRWEVDAPAEICTQSFRGAAALCLSSQGLLPTVTDVARSDRARLDFYPRTTGDFTLYGFLRAECAGEVEARVYYYRDDETFNVSETLPILSGGTADWLPFARDLSPPLGAGESAWARLVIAYGEPMTTGGRVALDELALLSWEELGDLDAGIALATPHGRDFLRIEGIPGDYQLSLTFRAERRSVEDAIMNCRQ